MFCFKCGNELKDDALFCTSCGAPTVNNLQALTEFEKNKNTAVEKAEETAEPEKAAEQEAAFHGIRFYQQDSTQGE